MVHRYLRRLLATGSFLFASRDEATVGVLAADYRLPLLDSGGASSMTTLEQLMTAAFNARVADGTWRRIFGGMLGIEPQPFCNGDVQPWLVPPVGPGTDLERVVDAGMFRCGYIQNDQDSSLDGKVLLESDYDSVSGAIVDYWNEIVNYASDAISKPIQIEWVLYSTPGEVFSAIMSGDVDASE